MAKRSLVPVERIEGAILVLRGHKVILDKNLAALYGVTTGNLNKPVNRNLEHFPADFMLQLTEEEFGDLKFHFGRSRWGRTRNLMIATNRGLARRLDELEKRYDAQFKGVFDAIRQLMAPPEKSRRSIGFRVEEGRPPYRRRRQEGTKA